MVKRAWSIFGFSLKAFVLLPLILLATPSPAEEVITLKLLASWAPTAHVIVYGFRPWVDRVNKELEGKLKVNWVGGPEVVRPFDQLKSVQTGIFDLLATTWAYHVDQVPAGQATNLFDATEEERQKVGYTQIMDEMYQKKTNLKLVGVLDCGTPYQIYLNKRIDRADLSGLKIRGTPFYHGLIKALNGSPVVTPPGEIYEAMARGVVDGYCWPLVGPVLAKWTEVTKYIVMPGFGLTQWPVLMNLDRWNRLPKSLQDGLIRITRLMGNEIYKTYTEKIVPREMQEMKKAGMQVIELPSEEGKKLVTVFYAQTWEEMVLKLDREYGPRLKAAAERLKK